MMVKSGAIEIIFKSHELPADWPVLTSLLAESARPVTS